MTIEKLVKHYLIDTVRDSVSRGVDDLGEGGFSERLSNRGVGNWRRKSNIVVADDVGVSEGVDWVAKNAGISEGADWLSDNVGVSEGAYWLSDDVGVSEGADLLSNNVGVSEGGDWMSNNAGVSKVGWNDRGDNTTLLPSGAGKSFLVSNGVGGSGLSNLWGFLWSNWGNQWSSNWTSNWANWKVVGSNTETIMSSGVFYSDFLSFGVDVGVTSANVSGSITDGSMGLSGVSISI
jgi:hypothetical protein